MKWFPGWPPDDHPLSGCIDAWEIWFSPITRQPWHRYVGGPYRGGVAEGCNSHTPSRRGAAHGDAAGATLGNLETER